MNIIKKLLVKVFKKAAKKAVDAEIPETKVEMSSTEPADEGAKPQEENGKSKVPVWVIVLKAIAYIIGLILGGFATTSCAGHLL